MFDALVIGGGFYGTSIALYLSRMRGFGRVMLLERESGLMRRASLNNQARIHNGYHYPRSLTTACASRVNLPNFVRDHPRAVKSDFTKIYAVARLNSRVTARQFLRFCHEIGAPIKQAPPSIVQLFEPRLIEGVFLAEEYAFDADSLAREAGHELAGAGTEIMYNCTAREIRPLMDPESLEVCYTDEGGAIQCARARYVFNCAYSGLNQLGAGFPGTTTKLKHEITEMALVRTPPAVRELGVTVMDGAYFSLMPFPTRGLQTLSHVRYTPHLHWLDRPGVDPYARLRDYPRQSRADRMLRDAARYMPTLRDTRYVDSIFEVKTLLVKNESDDGRPILFERHPELSNCYSVLGGKIDNIYDVLEKLDRETFRLAA
jgi:glycine/D-amino acid oxidase-like deaminating enzyme